MQTKDQQVPMKIVKWTEKDGIVYFTLVSGGISGDQWVEYFRAAKIPLSENALKILQQVVPSPAGTVYKVAVIKGSFLTERQLFTRPIDDEGNRRGFFKPGLELSPLIRAALSDDEIREMGLEEIVTFHHPVNGRFLDIDTETGKLESAPAGPYESWHAEHGFAFVEFVE